MASFNAASLKTNRCLISYDGARKAFVFRQFHTEGFVNTYVQQPTSDGENIVFVTEAIENTPAVIALARRTRS